jgi:hypothetical protein
MPVTTRLDPLETSKQIEATYKRYLKTLLAPSDRAIAEVFDNEIDKYWLCGCSPYILFKNSKSDLGKLNPKH